MPSLKEVRTRIESVNSTQQITSAMKMVSASKLRKAQNAILTLRPYALKMNEILQNLNSEIENSMEGGYAEKRAAEKILLVLINSNRGLCGAFNTNVVKGANNLINSTYKKQQQAGNVFIYCIGKKAADFYAKREEYKLYKSEIEIFNALNFENTVPLSEELMQDFLEKKFDRIILVYNQFKNAAVQRLITEQYLPISTKESETTEKNMQAADYIFEPDKKKIVSELIPKSLKIQLYKALLDSFASEHGARMTAMHKATDNAEELLKSLKLSYNKARQASITNEILEIVGGAEALKG